MLYTDGPVGPSGPYSGPTVQGRAPQFPQPPPFPTQFIPPGNNEHSLHTYNSQSSNHFTNPTHFTNPQSQPQSHAKKPASKTSQPVPKQRSKGRNKKSKILNPSQNRSSNPLNLRPSGDALLPVPVVPPLQPPLQPLPPLQPTLSFQQNMFRGKQSLKTVCLCLESLLFFSFCTHFASVTVAFLHFGLRWPATLQ